MNSDIQEGECHDQERNNGPGNWREKGRSLERQIEQLRKR